MLIYTIVLNASQGLLGHVNESIGLLGITLVEVRVKRLL